VRRFQGGLNLRLRNPSAAGITKNSLEQLFASRQILVLLRKINAVNEVFCGTHIKAFGPRDIGERTWARARSGVSGERAIYQHFRFRHD
jgi:hypothetical protein